MQNEKLQQKKIAAKIGSNFKLGKGVPLREVEDAKLWKNTKLATKVRTEETERRRLEMLDTEGNPFNQKLELSEVSLRKSQKKLQSLIYKDRA